MRRHVLVIGSVLFLGCGGGGSSPDAAPDAQGTAPDAGVATFDFPLGEILEVEVTMPEADWDALRFQANDPYTLLGPGCQDGPPQREFTYFTADIVVDGTPVADVGVRKKGYLGSLSIGRPSLKVDLDRNVPGQEWGGLEKLTLNNNKQDTAMFKTCLAYSVFRRAGVPAPRCNMAHVTVNGQDLGIYSNVESVQPRMLGRWFADQSGNLYEGSISDVRVGWSATYEKKTNELDPDRSDLDAFVAALDAATDDEVADVVAQHVDLDAFLTFWAAESLIGHWDGYSNNTNNHFIYRDPTSQRFHFLPWGADLTFTDLDPFMPESRPQSLSANGWLARRLYAVPEIRAMYVARMQELLDQAWDETAILADLDALEALLAPYAADEALYAAEVDKVRAFVTGRRAAIEAELAGGPPAWDYPARATPCLFPAGTASGTFMTTHGTAQNMNPFADGTGALDINGQIPGLVGAAAGYDTQSGLGARQQVQVVGVLDDGTIIVAVLFIDPEVWIAGEPLVFDWQTAFGAAYRLVDGEPVLEGLFNAGTFTLDAAGTSDGEPVSGSFTADMLI